MCAPPSLKHGLGPACQNKNLQTAMPMAKLLIWSELVGLLAKLFTFEGVIAYYQHIQIPFVYLIRVSAKDDSVLHSSLQRFFVTFTKLKVNMFIRIDQL